MTQTPENNTEKKGKIRQNYSHKKADAKKDLRRNQAIDRQARYDAKTTNEKIELVRSRGGSKRELNRLLGITTKNKQTNVVPVVETTAPTTEEKPKNKYRQGKKRKTA